jgi:hypothetical protein
LGSRTSTQFMMEDQRKTVFLSTAEVMQYDLNVLSDYKARKDRIDVMNKGLVHATSGV